MIPIARRIADELQVRVTQVEATIALLDDKSTVPFIARNIPSAASMCYDAGANQLVIPMNANNALAFVPLR